MDPATLAALGRLEVVSRWLVDGLLAGLHRSPKKGFSVEFAEHREYQPGDDLRFMDWKVVARADKWLIKQFEEETNVRATLVLDVSRSMAWRGAPGRLTKLAYAEQLVAALALLFVRQRDAVGLIRFDDVLRTVIPPRSGQTHFRKLLGCLDEPGVGQGSDVAGALAQAGKLITRRGMVILVSDLLLDPQEIADTIQALRAQGHDVTCLHVIDPAERSLDLAAGEATFVDPERGDATRVAPADVRDAYRDTVDGAIAEWRAHFAAAGAFYEPVFTDQPFGVPLRRAFARRQRLS